MKAKDFINIESALERIGLLDKIDIIEKRLQKMPVFSVRGGGGVGGGIDTEVDPLSLHLDQTTPQEIINGAPIFTKGLVIKAGERIYFDG
jgi:hypothetical protein